MSAITAPVSHADRFFIGGEWVAPSSDATIDVIDSSNEELYYTVAEAAPDDVSRAVAAARHAFGHEAAKRDRTATDMGFGMEDRRTR